MRVSMVSEYFTLRCSTGEITDIPYWGVYSRGSDDEINGVCDSKDGSKCSALSDKSHPLLKELKVC